MMDVRGTLVEAAAEVMHHNRNRPAMIDRIMTPDGMRALGMSPDDELVARSMAAFSFMHSALTPDDETCVVISRIGEYLDMGTAIEDDSHVYGLAESMRAMAYVMDRLPEWSVTGHAGTMAWLRGRGVSEDQARRWGLVDMSRLRHPSVPEEIRVWTGATVHPALRRWIGEKSAPSWVPDGVMTPVMALDGTPLGCHNRLLSTVPKMKFCSSVPNMWLFTNLRTTDLGLARANPLPPDGEVRCPSEIYVVEGVFDALAVERAAAAAGRTDVGFVAPSTGYWEPEQWMALASMLLEFPYATVVMMFDNDRVGAKSNLCAAYAVDKGLGLHVELRRWPRPAKDPAEAVVRHGLGLSDLQAVGWGELKREYDAMPHERLRDYEEYMSSRHASYSNDNYGWEK